ncbi:hypothetical protein [Streptomyces sp. NPDC005385]|uniref:hypothetical protein n=1 Tax=Streptomyces sp. NPDC005385 TaxID=3157039 RepID=UPI0033AE3104
MAAVPAHLDFDCPACSEPIRLDMKLGPATKEQGRLTARLVLNVAPLTDHLADVHGLTPETPRCGTPSAVSETHADVEAVSSSRPAPALAANAAATAAVTFHVHRAPDPDSASAAIRREMRLGRQTAYLPPGGLG